MLKFFVFHVRARQDEQHLICSFSAHAVIYSQLAMTNYFCRHEAGKHHPETTIACLAECDRPSDRELYRYRGAIVSSPSGAEVVAVAFPPWWTSQRAFLAAASVDAIIVRTTLPSLLVVRIDQPAGLNRLREAGAWFALDPQAIAACFRQ